MTEKISPQPSETMIWVDGNGYGYGNENLRGRIYRARNNIERQIRDTQDEINSFAQKERRGGRLYWYRWVNGTWKYIGPVSGKVLNKDPNTGKRSMKDIVYDDPRVPFQEKLAKLEQELKDAEPRMQSCVIKKLGDHLLIDIPLFRAHVDKDLPDNIIKVKDVI